MVTLTRNPPSRVIREEIPAGQVITYAWHDPADLFKISATLAVALPLHIIFIGFLRSSPFNPVLYAVVVVTGAVTYLMFAFAFNKTKICITGSYLSVKHGPLLWKGNFRIETREVDQLYYTERKGKSTSYQIQVTLKSGGRREIAAADKRNDADKIIQNIRRAVNTVIAATEGKHLVQDSIE